MLQQSGRWFLIDRGYQMVGWVPCPWARIGEQFEELHLVLLLLYFDLRLCRKVSVSFGSFVLIGICMGGSFLKPFVL